ncbi:hypothetical protein ACFL1Y_00260 [Patescibacteria group bacterium]
MTEGTKSVLFGCHNIIHSWYVIKAWKILYKKWPETWQMICILFHDAGLLGKNYLSDSEGKENHWFLGACISGILFGEKGFNFVASHTKNPFIPLNLKFKAADRYSHVISNSFWPIWNKWIEPEITEPKKWRFLCEKNMNCLDKSTHEIFLENK